MHARLLVFASLDLAFSQLAGCLLPKEQRGELVGAYHVDGELTENSCGRDALPAPDHLSFDVEVRNDKGEGLWLRGKPPAQSGTLDSSGYFAFEMTNSYDVPGAQTDPNESLNQLDPEKLADPTLIERMDQAAQKGCRLTVEETVHGKLLRAARDLEGGEGAGATDSASSDMTADNEIDIRANAGSNCARVLATDGGPFERLPCHAHYDLSGQLSAKK